MYLHTFSCFHHRSILQRRQASYITQKLSPMASTICASICIYIYMTVYLYFVPLLQHMCRCNAPITHNWQSFNASLPLANMHKQFASLSFITYINMMAYMHTYIFICIFASALHINATKAYLCKYLHRYIYILQIRCYIFMWL